MYYCIDFLLLIQYYWFPSGGFYCLGDWPVPTISGLLLVCSVSSLISARSSRTGLSVSSLTFNFCRVLFGIIYQIISSSKLTRFRECVSSRSTFWGINYSVLAPLHCTSMSKSYCNRLQLVAERGGESVQRLTVATIEHNAEAIAGRVKSTHMALENCECESQLSVSNYSQLRLVYLIYFIIRYMLFIRL